MCAVLGGQSEDAQCIQCSGPHKEKLYHLESGMVIKNRFIAEIL